MSPTVLRSGPYRFFFFSNEAGEAPHIHVHRDKMLAKFWLDPVKMAGSTGVPPGELRRIRHLVMDNQALFLEAWHAFFAR